MKRLAFIHTAQWHAGRFGRLADAKLQGWSSYAVVDESLLRDTIERGEVADTTVQSLASHVIAAADAGAAAVVVTCSTLGSAVDAMRPAMPVPLFRIDRGMAAAAVTRARRIGVLATLQTTLAPTAALVADEAAAVNADCEISTFLCEGAFGRLRQGDKETHDRAVRDGFARLASSVDLVLLAQASMADAIDGAAAHPFLSSPDVGMEHIARQLRGV